MDGLRLVPQPEPVVLHDEVLVLVLRGDQILAQLVTDLLVLLRQLLENSLLGLDLAFELRLLIPQTDRDLLQLVHLCFRVSKLLRELLLAILQRLLELLRLSLRLLGQLAIVDPRPLLQLAIQRRHVHER